MGIDNNARIKFEELLKLDLESRGKEYFRSVSKKLLEKQSPFSIEAGQVSDPKYNGNPFAINYFDPIICRIPHPRYWPDLEKSVPSFYESIDDRWKGVKEPLSNEIETKLTSDWKQVPLVVMRFIAKCLKEETHLYKKEYLNDLKNEINRFKDLTKFPKLLEITGPLLGELKSEIDDQLTIGLKKPSTGKKSPSSNKGLYAVLKALADYCEIESGKVIDLVESCEVITVERDSIGANLNNAKKDHTEVLSKWVSKDKYQ